MKKILMLICAGMVFLPAIAQDGKERKRDKKEERRQRIDAISKQEEEGVIKYKKHTVGGLKLTNDGYGAFLEIGRARSVKKALLFQLDIMERKHQREIKQQKTVFSSSNPFIYSKINFFYPIKLGVQQQMLLGNKGNKNGVSITANVGGGLIAGLLRPYKVVVLADSGTKSISYYDDPEQFLLGNIQRGPGFGTGWNKLKVTPGIYIKPALRFDYGKYNEMVNAIEVGLTAEYYTKEIDQMVFQKREKFFFNAYVSILFGRRK